MSAGTRQTSVSTSSISQEHLHKLAVESAFDIESDKRAVSRWLSLGAGGVVTLAVMGWCMWFGLGPVEVVLGALAGLMFAIPVGLGVAGLSMPLGALWARRRFLAHTRALGIGDVDAQAAYVQAQQVIDDLVRGRLVTGAQAPRDRR